MCKCCKGPKSKPGNRWTIHLFPNPLGAVRITFWKLESLAMIRLESQDSPGLYAPAKEFPAKDGPSNAGPSNEAPSNWKPSYEAPSFGDSLDEAPFVDNSEKGWVSIS